MLRSPISTTLVLLFVATSSGALSSAADCDSATFAVLATSPTLAQCMANSGVSWLELKATPTEEQLAKICQTAACRQMLKSLVDMNPSECIVPLAGRLRLRGDLMDPVVSYCASHGLDVTTTTTGATTSTQNGSGSHASSTKTNQKNETIQSPGSVPTSYASAHGIAMISNGVLIVFVLLVTVV